MVALGLEATLGWFGPTQSEGLLKPATGAPLASRQGAFSNGSTIPKLRVLVQKSLLIGGSHLDVVDAFHIGDIRAQAGVGQRPVLADGFLLDGAEVGKRIVAGVVVVLVAPDKAAQREHRIGIERPGPRWRDVEGLDLRALVGRADRDCRSESSHVQVVERQFGVWNQERVKPRFT